MFVAVLRGWATMTLGHYSSWAGLVRQRLCHEVVITCFGLALNQDAAPGSISAVGFWKRAAEG